MKIAVNKDRSEFEIQAEALALLREALGPFYIVRGEVTYNGCRFDLAVFRASNRELLCTIEVKKKGGPRKHNRQVCKYTNATRRPCIVLNGNNIAGAILAVRNGLAAVRRLNQT